MLIARIISAARNGWVRMALTAWISKSRCSMALADTVLATVYPKPAPAPVAGGTHIRIKTI
ncbi:hypothetical protein MKFW12EY_40880 [Methylomonas koyamae]|nr:hypothetical protein MKFW12EY_40880 [Methylomonas koyamae]